MEAAFLMFFGNLTYLKHGADRTALDGGEGSKRVILCVRKKTNV